MTYSAGTVASLLVREYRKRRTRPPNAPDQLGGGEGEHDQRPWRCMHEMILEQDAKHPCDVTILAALGDRQLECDVVRGVEGPRLFQESRRIGREVATHEGVVDIGADDRPPN